MKNELEVLSSRPRIAFNLDRDSVCAADDFESHEAVVETYSFVDPIQLAKELSSGYLPSVAGYGHWWECVLNGAVIARIFPNGKAERVADVTFSEENSVHFKYHAAAF